MQTVAAWAERRRGRFRRLSGQLLPQLPVVDRPLLGIQQAHPGRGDFVEQTLRMLALLARLERPQNGHPLIGGVGDRVEVVFKQTDAQQ